MVRLTDRRYMAEILLLWHKKKQVSKSTKGLDDAFSDCSHKKKKKTFQHHTDVFNIDSFYQLTVVRWS